MSRAGFAGVDVGGGGIRVRIEAGEIVAYGEDTAPVPRERGRVDLDRLATRIAKAIENAPPTPDGAATPDPASGSRPNTPLPPARPSGAGRGRPAGTGTGTATGTSTTPGPATSTGIAPGTGTGTAVGTAAGTFPGIAAGIGDGAAVAGFDDGAMTGGAVARHRDALVLDRFAGMAIGVTGLPGLVRDPGTLWEALGERLGLDALVVAGDMVTTHVGALGFRPGVVVAAGTGVITLGTDLDQVWNQSDGWGHLLGDHGGGAWIGTQGLHAALRAHDGRAGGSPALLERMIARFGHPLDLVALVYESDSAAHHLASFAPQVADAARAGDPVARRIWTEAGRQLGQTAVAAAAGLDPVFSWGGRLFDAADLLMEPFQSTVRESLPDARFRPPLGTSADGALALAKAAADGAVRPRHPYLYVFTRTAGPGAPPLRRTR